MYYSSVPSPAFQDDVDRKKMDGDGFFEKLERPPASPNMRALFGKFEAGGRTKWHWHEGPQLLFGTEGNGLVDIQGLGRFEIEEGTRVIVPPGTWHRHGAEGKGRFIHLAVTTGSTFWEGDSTAACKE